MSTYENEGTQKLYMHVLKMFNDEEVELSKDLYDFDGEKILKVLERRKYQKPQLKTAYKKYMIWGLNYFHRSPENGKIDLEKLLQEAGLDEKNNQRELQSVFTRSTLELLILGKINSENYIDYSIILLAFEGIGSVNELLSLRAEDVDDRWITTSRGRRILLTPGTANVVRKAISEEYYYYNNGDNIPRRNYTILKNTGYVIRTDIDGMFNSNSYNTRMDAIQGFTDRPNLSFTTIQKSGIMDYFITMEAKKGQSLTRDDVRKVCTWFGEDLTKNSNETKLLSFYQDFKRYNHIDDDSLELRRDDKDFDLIFQELDKVQFEYKKFTPKKNIFETPIHKALESHPNPETLSEEEPQDTEFQKKVTNGVRKELPQGKIPRPPLISGKGSGVGHDKYPRDPDIAKTALEDAHYLCIINPEHLSFESKITGKNFVEAHHFVPMSVQRDFEYSLDVPENIFSLCPNCHRAFHHAIPEVKRAMIEKLYPLVDNQLIERGIVITLEEFFKIYGVKEAENHKF